MLGPTDRQAAASPDAPAVLFEDRHVTYGEIESRANQLARHLKERGVGPDVLVGLLVDRSIDMVVALFGVMKAGGTYVPLDPVFPRDRLSYMIEDSRMALLVTHRGLDATLTARPQTIVRLDDDWAEIATQSGRPLPA